MKKLTKWLGKNKKWVVVTGVVLTLWWSAEHPVLNGFEQCTKDAQEKFYSDKDKWCSAYGIGPSCLSDNPAKVLLEGLKKDRIECANKNPY